MRSLSTNANNNIWKMSPEARAHVRILDSDDSLITSFDTSIKNFGRVSRRIKPFGGNEIVSSLSISNLERGQDTRFYSEASITNKEEYAVRGAGRIIKSDETYSTARNATSGDFAVPTITVGQRYNAAALIYGVYVGICQFTIPSLTDCNEAVLFLKGLGDYSTTDFDIYLLEGNWTALSEAGAMFNDYEGWASSGEYSVTQLGETYNTANYVTYDSSKDDNEAYNLIKLNAAGRQYIEDNAGSVARFALISKRHAENTEPTGNEYVNFDASSVMLKLRYDTKTLDNKRVTAYRYYEPFTGTYADMQLIYSGVIDHHSLNDSTLNLTVKKSDPKSNVMIPEKVMTKETSGFQYIPDDNVGKAIPEIYGDFMTGFQHKDHAAYAQSEHSSSNYYGLSNDYAVAYVHRPNGVDASEIHVTLADHLLKDVDFTSYVYDRSMKTFSILPGDIIDGTVGTQTRLAIRAGTNYTEWPFSVIVNTNKNRSLLQPIVSITPKEYTDGVGNGVTLGSANNALSNVIDTVITLGSPSDPLASGLMYVCQDSFGPNSITGNVYLVFKAEILEVGGSRVRGGTVNNSDGMFPMTPTNAVSITASGWYWFKLTSLPTNPDIPSEYGIFFAGYADDSDKVEISNISLCTGYQMDLQTTVYFRCQGRPDDASGTITGSASALIENPSHIIESIARNSMGHDTADIDTTDFDTAATTLANWKFAFQLLKQQQADRLLDSLGEQSKTAVFRNESDQLTVKAWNTSTTFPHSGTDIPDDEDIFSEKCQPTVTDGDEYMTRNVIINESLTMDQVPSRDVKNAFILKYRKNPASGDYLETLTMDNGEGDVDEIETNLVASDESSMEDSQTIAGLKALCAASYTNAGDSTNVLIFEADLIRERATAVKLLQHLIEVYTPRRRIVKFTTRENALWLEFGDVINIRAPRVYDEIGIVDPDCKKWLPFEISPHLGQKTITIQAIEVEYGA